MLDKKKLFFGFLVGAATVANAAAGHIYDIRPYYDGSIQTGPHSSREKPMVGGETVRFAVRLACEAAYTGQNNYKWYLDYIGIGSIEVAKLYHPFKIGIYVSGQLREARLVEGGIASSDVDYTDFIFEYTVQPGDFALPIVLAVSDGKGGATPATGTSVSDVSYYVPTDAYSYWSIRNTAGDKANLWFGTWNIIRPSGAEAPWYDYDLRGAGFYVKTVDFDSDWRDAKTKTYDGIWRDVREGSTKIKASDNGKGASLPSLVVNSAATNVTTLHVWCDNPDAVTVTNANEDLWYDVTMNLDMFGKTKATYRVLDVTVKQGIITNEFSLFGVSSNKTANLILSANTNYTYTSSGIRYNDYISVPVRCVEKSVPQAPVIYPETGKIFATSLTVSMSTASNDTTIHYTTDGTIPTIESPVYKKFRIWGKTMIKAIAFYEDGTPSEMTVAEYAMGTCENPVITPVDGSTFQRSGQQVSINWVGTNGVVRYTTDGSDPTKDSPVYVAPFAIDDTATIKAKLFSDTYFDSEIVSATLTRVWTVVATPVISAEPFFTGSKNKVSISCETDGATIYYTTDGSLPTDESSRYEKQFCVTNGCTVKAVAVLADFKDSDVVEMCMVRKWSIGETMGRCDHKFETDGNAGFVRADDATAILGESMRSGTIDNCQTSILSTVVVGPGTVSFRWKTSCEEDYPQQEWDRAEFWIDGRLIKKLDGVTGWQSVVQEIEGCADHALSWLYVKDRDESEGEDCMWVSQFAWNSELTETQTTSVPVPYDWLKARCCGVVDEYDSYEKVAKEMALNGRLTVEQCYVAGVDPESPTNDFRSR